MVGLLDLFTGCAVVLAFFVILVFGRFSAAKAKAGANEFDSNFVLWLMTEYRGVVNLFVVRHPKQVAVDSVPPALTVE